MNSDKIHVVVCASGSKSHRKQPVLKVQPVIVAEVLPTFEIYLVLCIHQSPSFISNAADKCVIVAELKENLMLRMRS